MKILIILLLMMVTSNLALYYQQYVAPMGKYATSLYIGSIVIFILLIAEIAYKQFKTMRAKKIAA